MGASRTGERGPTSPATIPTGSVSTPMAPLGMPMSATSTACGSARAARCCKRSSSTAAASPACSVATSYRLSASVATPLIGRLGDMYGKERVLMIVLALLSIGTVVSALATSLPLMLVGRVVQGAAGGIFPLAFGIIRDEFPRPRVASGLGLMSSLLGVGGEAGVVLAGPIVQGLDYHWLFWLPLVVLVPATIAVHLFVPESPVRVPGRINWSGAALM